MKKHNIFNPMYFLVLLIVAITAYHFLVPVRARDYFSSETAMGRWLKPTKDSLKKAANLIHLPYWLRKSELPAYYINISSDNQEKMIASLPFDPDTFSYGILTDEDKQYVNADFISPADGYEARIKIRYRGGAPNNWNAEKKSLRIKFPKDNLYSGMAGLHFLLPSDNTYFAEALNVYRAQKLGLLARERKLVRVFVNGIDNGVYWTTEPWSKEFLARNGLIDTDNIFSNKDKPGEDEFLFKKSRLTDWQSYTAENDGPFEELQTLLALVEDADDKEFAEKIGNLLDLEKFYRWQLLYALAGSNHISDHHNFALLFRQETGKFELLPFDLNVGSLHVYADIPTLPKRILANEQFLKEYQKVVNDYTSDENNLEDDLAYYDGLYQEYFYEFYKDQTKAHPDYIFDRKVKEYRSFFVADFKSARELTAALLPSDFILEQTDYGSGPVGFEGSFKHFNDIFLDIDRFLTKNPQFKKINHNSIVLSAGEHIFNDVTIVPEGLYLIIEPGAKLLFSPGASIISYSPVTAVGTSSSQIELRPLWLDSAPWGGFAVINTGGAENKFYYVNVSGGGAAPVINGVPYLSQFNLHNAVSEIFYSTFENGRSDDVLHVVGGSVKVAGSVIKNTSSDGIDIDFVKGGSITDSIFFNSKPEDSNGDGIDLSGTEKMEITNNRIVGFGDKCISVGEKADVIIKDNVLAGCGMGVAVKDDSVALIERNVIGASKLFAISLYRKKPEFIKGGNAEEIDNIFISNKENISADEFSSVTAVNKNTDASEKNHDLRLLLPAYLYDLIPNTQ